MILEFLLVVLVCVLVYWAVMKLLAAGGVGDPIATIVQVLLVIVGIIWAAGRLGISLPGL